MLTARVAGLHLLVLVSVCSSSAAQNTANESARNTTNESVYDPDAENIWVTAEDKQLAEWASQAVTTWCAEGFKGNHKAMEKAKEEASDNNIIVTILEENLTDFGDEKKRERLIELTTAYVLGDGLLIVVPLLMALLSVIVWLFCCWCACCQRCRCCQTKRKKSAGCISLQTCVVVVFFLVLAALGLGVRSSHGTVVDGIDNVRCATSKMLNVSLQGSSGATGFIGMMPVLDKFFWIEQQMKAQSPLLTDIGSVLDRTADIERSVVLVAEEIKLLSAMLNDYQNTYPFYGDNISLDHTCELCEKLGPIVAAIDEGLRDGMGNALNKARAEVDFRLSPSNREHLADTVKQAAEPLQDAKKQMNELLKPLVDPSVFSKEDQKLVQQQMLLAFLEWLIMGLLLVCCGSCSTLCCATRWENMVILPAGMACDFLTTVDGDMLKTIAEHQGQNTSADAFVIGKGLVDACWVGDDGTNPNLLDIIFTRDDNGTAKYLREQLVTDVTRPIDASFEDIIEKMGSMNISLASSPAFTNLQNVIASSSVSGLMIPSQRVTKLGGEWRGDATYGGLMLDTPVMVAIATQSDCDNFTFEGQTLTGVQFFADLLLRLPGAQPAGAQTLGCVRKADCSAVPTTGGLKEACESGNAFLDLKTKLMDGTAQFKCNLFKNQDGSKCDPINMVRQPNGEWQNDCLMTQEDGLVYVEQFEENCTLDQFDAYIKDFAVRLNMSVSRLDNVTETVLDVIVHELRAVLDKYFINTLHEVAEGITCGFVAPIRDELVDGLCYQTLPGMTTINNIYAAAAALIILLALDMFILYRVMIDNVDIFSKEGHFSRNVYDQSV